ncbi:hypothetical protein [Yinghuangia seranimata]|uniref:hypothetical protein n=1 Tax=Yinghuangia seranimata TaxID=408067 RepID=UPI00248AC429|nr:hypothetical protein [Yinghuangia seranimata]MDI2132292.1 hypothetical protein [Yinghuangia seranimata]
MGTEMFQVNVDQMRALVTKLQAAQAAMTDAMAAMNKTDADRVGTKKLDQACNTFQKKWKYGLDQIEKDIDATIKGVDEAMKAYQEVDKALAGLFPSPGGP